MATSTNTFPFFIAAGILALTGIYFYVSDLERGAVVMECAAVLFLTVGVLLRRQARASK